MSNNYTDKEIHDILIHIDGISKRMHSHLDRALAAEFYSLMQHTIKVVDSLHTENVELKMLALKGVW